MVAEAARRAQAASSAAPARQVNISKPLLTAGTLKEAVLGKACAAARGEQVAATATRERIIRIKRRDIKAPAEPIGRVMRRAVSEAFMPRCQRRRLCAAA